MPRPTVYLAGPTVFEPDPEALFAVMRTICAEAGLEGVSPLDNQIGLEGSPGLDLVSRIVAADIALMHRLDAGLFCLDGFRRGPEMDAGTAFEAGYMHALGKPLAGWTRDPAPYPERVRAHFTAMGLGLHQTPPKANHSGTLRDPDGMLVHSEGCMQNAMVEVAIHRSGGRVHADLAWTRAFTAAIRDLGRRLGATPPSC